ncbi:MAG: 3-carboxy-cis,cis-muconate cycloisomerase [Alphaproteobacteria bacterium]|nr:3-carboxy-cis,cis-muconate cycloisomerase [Alphaproteobacteria bacterium]
MPSTVFDSNIYKNLFGAEDMRRIFSDENHIQMQLDVESALARVQARLDIIPQDAADEITAKAKFENLDFDAFQKSVERVYSPILPLVEGIVAACKDGLGEYSHWGATTQDIMDSGLSLQLRDALALVDKELTAISGSLVVLAKKYRDTPMAGRSHLQHALPITFGYKAAVWLSGIERHRTRLEELLPRATQLQFSGAAGTLASLGDKGLAVQDALADELGLLRPEITWHTMRDNVAEITNFLGLVTGTLAKIGTDVLMLMQTEVGEVFEPFAPGRGASSTMPQKRNPVSSELLIIAAKAARQNVAMMLDGMIQDHERASGPWHVEWLALPQIFILTSGSLFQARDMLEGLIVDADRMRANLDLTNGMIVSEAVMMGLAPSMGRQVAHDVVYDLCREALSQNRSLRELLCETAAVTEHLTDERIGELCEPGNYTGQAGEMVDRMLAKVAATQR